MTSLLRCLIPALTAASLVAATAQAADDFVLASSRQPTAIPLCGDGGVLRPGACEDGRLVRLAREAEDAFQAMLASAPALARPLLRRDQVWFGEMVVEAARYLSEAEDDDRNAFEALLPGRINLLRGMTTAFGRSGVVGRWAYAFGQLDISAAENGMFRIVISTDSRYGLGSERRRSCAATALVGPDRDGWWSGRIVTRATLADPGEARPVDPDLKPDRPATIRMRRQGGTLRLVLVDADWRDQRGGDCAFLGQVTATYFPVGPAAADAAAETSLVQPSFDCTRPETAADEEICADPALADNDQKLNRGWKALLPRLDEATRRALIDDQRKWIAAQAVQYPEFLHPGWDKRSSFMHYTSLARQKLEQLQQERLALIDGFDERRTGLQGLWLSSTAALKVSMDGKAVKAEGWKWDQGDWKAGCTYAMTGRIVNGAFRSEDERRNPDTLERDHAMLVVNRLDDMFAKKRSASENSDDEPKCRRNVTISSTARLFPVRPSPAIDPLASSIR